MVDRAIGVVFLAAAVVQAATAWQAWSIWREYRLAGFDRQAGLAIGMGLLCIASGALFWIRGSGGRSSPRDAQDAKAPKLDPPRSAEFVRRDR